MFCAAGIGFPLVARETDHLFRLSTGVLSTTPSPAVRNHRITVRVAPVSAQRHLGDHYQNGLGVVQDYIKAHFWYNLAAASGNIFATKSRDAIASIMTQGQVAHAQEMARQHGASNREQVDKETENPQLPRRRTEKSPQQKPSISQLPKSQASQGTGFFVSADGYVITNAHVVAGCAKIVAIDAEGSRFGLSVERISHADDLALLKADTRRRSFAAFCDPSNINQGKTVVAYGYPFAQFLSSSGNVSSGLITALAGIDDNPLHLQISAPVQPGNSGGPLVDLRGSIIGVVVSKLDANEMIRLTDHAPENVNFAIKTSAVFKLLNASSVKYWSMSSQQEFSIGDLTQQLKKYTVKIECD